MKHTDMDSPYTLVRFLVFTVLMAVSATGLAQAGPDSAMDTTPVEAEQVDINHADAETIARVLVGIGMSRAQAIVAYREEFGDFANLDELMMVRGVGETTLKNNEARIRFSMD